MTREISRVMEPAAVARQTWRLANERTLADRLPRAALACESPAMARSACFNLSDSRSIADLTPRLPPHVMSRNVIQRLSKRPSRLSPPRGLRGTWVGAEFQQKCGRA